MRLERSISIEQFPSYTAYEIGEKHVVFLHVLRILCWEPGSSQKWVVNAKQRSFLCHSKFFGHRHRHTEGWSPSVVVFLEDGSGLNVGNRNVCVKHVVKAPCIQWRPGITVSLTSSDGWRLKRSLCVVYPPVAPLISRLKSWKAWVYLGGDMWFYEDSYGVESPEDVSLCTKHYQQVYRMINAKSHACKSC